MEELEKENEENGQCPILPSVLLEWESVCPCLVTLVSGDSDIIDDGYAFIEYQALVKPSFNL